MSSMGSPGARNQLYPIHHPSVAWRAVGDEVVVITPQDSVLHTFNPTGSFIWQEATGQKTVQEIARHVAEKFEVSPPTALADVAEFIEDLRQKGLLTISPEKREAGGRE